MRDSTQAAADVDREAAMLLSVRSCPNLRDPAEVVDGDEGAGFIFASGECDLELPAKVLGVAVSKQVKRDRFCVRGNVEDFGMAHAGKGAGRHVSDGVAAGFSGGDATR